MSSIVDSKRLQEWNLIPKDLQELSGRKQVNQHVMNVLPIYKVGNKELLGIFSRHIFF